MLVDLEKDLGETTDLGQKHPEVVARLLKEMKEFRGQ